MKMQDSGFKLSNAMILELENQLQIELPQDYKDFMLANNGGTPEEDWAFDFVELDPSKITSSIIQEFMIIYAEETMEVNDLRAGYVALVESGQIPKALLPIAEDPGGNLICISVSEKDYGRVYFGNHELEVPETGYIVMSLIANSFSEFIAKLYVYEDK